ncbi:MAG TPA: TonB family protein [Rhodanobacteraceae bacterium]|nr:TonB family protein [Rhodanobacteraceae bacterium]
MHALALCLACACIGLLLTLILRWPARRLAGPGPAFTLWVLPVLLAIISLLPKQAVPAFDSTSLTILPALFVQPQAPAAASVGFDMPWLAIWLAGSALVMLRTLLHYLRIRRSSHPLSASLRKTVTPMLPPRLLRHARMHAEGPAVLWSWPCRLLLPPDFIERFDTSGRAQVLAHEQTHLARRDPLWSLAAEIVLAALWFFPPAWWAMGRFRLDQELACDAAVLRRAPDQAARYARALVDHCDSGTPLPVLNAWFSTSQLKERLMMIQHPHTLLRRPLGYVALTLLIGGMALTVQAALPGQAIAPPQKQAAVGTTTDTNAKISWASKANNPPRYPPAAIKKHEQGTVVLKVHVDSHGKPTSLVYDPDNSTTSSQNLINAAIKAARQWRFTPATRNGKPVASWVRVPVKFALPKQNKAAAPPGLLILLPSTPKSSDR